MHSWLCRLKFGGEDVFSDALPPQEKKLAIHEILKGWRVHTSKSPMDDSTNVYIYLYADKAVKGWLDEKAPQLILRCQENKTEAYIDTDMQLQTDYGDYHHATVRLRFDQDKARSVRFSKSTDGEALFAPNAIPLIKEMMKHQTMAFEFTPYNSGPVTVNFDVSGLDKNIAQLRKSCNW
jgi:type VI secretion system protein VasI